MGKDCECNGHKVMQAELAIVIVFFIVIEAKQLMQIYRTKKESESQGNNNNYDNNGNDNNGNDNNGNDNNKSNNKDNNRFQWY